MQETEIWPFEQMVYAQQRICPGEWHTQTPLRFWHPNGLLNLGQTTGPYYNQQKKRTCRYVDFAFPADHRVQLKESEKKNKYLDLTRKLKKLWNMKVAVTQTPVKDHQPTLMWKTPSMSNNTDGSPNLGQKNRPYNNQGKKKKICKIVDFAVPADHRIKLKEYENKDKG